MEVDSPFIFIDKETLSLKIKGESTSIKVLPWDPFATFNNVAVLIHSFVQIGCAFVAMGSIPTILFSCLWHEDF
jgi:hypothetical protein